MAFYNVYNVEPKIKMSKLRILKNLGVISFSFVLLFTAYDGLSALQSTMNGDDGVGSVGQGLMYIMFCVSALLLPKYVIQNFGCRCSIIISQICYGPYILSNFYPRWVTIIPTAIIQGLASSTMWGGQCTYFNKASVLYCFNEENEEKPYQKGRKSSVYSLEPALHERYSKRTSSVLNPFGCPKQISVLGASGFHPISTANGISNPSFDADVIIRNGSLQGTNDLEEMEGFRKSIKRHEVTNAQFFGCHSFLYKTAEIWSNLMSYYILKSDSGADLIDTSCSCGADFCNDEPQCLTKNLGVVSDERRYLLSGLCIGLLVLGIIMLILFLEPIDGSREPVPFSFSMFSATAKQLAKREQIYLTPLSLLIGIIQGFYIGDFTKAYIGCAWGTYHIGLVTIGYGLFGAITSSISGWLVKYIGRIPVITFGILSTIGTCILLLMWTPNASQAYVFYLISSLFGTMVGILWSQIPAFYGVLFKEDEEAAFAGFYTWDSLGWALPFILSNYLCTYIKIYALIFLSCLGLVGYLMTERTFSLKKKEHS